MEDRPGPRHGASDETALHYLKGEDPEEDDAPPELRHPVLIAAFAGWNDAGEAASHAGNHLARAWQCEPFAEIDAEQFFDFTEVRPEVTLVDGHTRRIVWPSTGFSLAASVPGHPDAVLARGYEPQLKWRTYCEAFIELAQALKVERVVTLGAYLAEVTHNRPVPVHASSSDPEYARAHNLSTSRYEGPTGIVGVLGSALAEAGLQSISVWASVPCYSLPVSPKASLALARLVTGFVGRDADLSELETESVEYEQRMDELVAEDENIAAYVARIEEMQDELPDADVSAEGLADEIERFLRGGRRD